MELSKLKERLSLGVPGFGKYLDSDSNLFSSKTYHGVFTACSIFVRDHAVQNVSWVDLAEVLNSAAQSENQDCENAVFTCFIENLATRDHPLVNLLEGSALEYWRRWCEGA